MTITELDPAHTPGSAVPPTGPGLGAAFQSEWIKLRTARSPRRNLLLGTLLGVGFSALLGLVVGATFSDWPAADQADFDPLLFSLSGGMFTAIFFAAVGVNVVASEYTSGMIRLTLTVTPKRSRVLYAKGLAVTLATFVFGAIAAVGMFASSQAIFAAYDLPTAGLGTAEVWRTLLLISVISPLFPVIAVAITVMLRSTAAALSTVLALIFAPSIFGGLLPRWWQENIISLLPGPASDSVAIGHLADSSMYLHPAPAVGVLVVWLVVLYGLANVVLNRRDA